MVYRCKNCGCVHGWEKHPRVELVTRHIRYPAEDVWYCPACNKEHRTSDGSFMGRMFKEYEELEIKDLDRRPKMVFVDGNGDLYDENGRLIHSNWRRY